MNASETTRVGHATNYFRRSLGVLLAAAPFFLFIVSFVYSVFHDAGSRWTAIPAAGIAAFFAALNFYCSFIRPSLYRWRHGSMDGFRFVSSFPIIGTVFAVVATIIGFGAVGTTAVCLVATAFDTGAGHWFVYSTWRDRGLWDA